MFFQTEWECCEGKKKWRQRGGETFKKGELEMEKRRKGMSGGYEIMRERKRDSEEIETISYSVRRTQAHSLYSPGNYPGHLLCLCSHCFHRALSLAAYISPSFPLSLSPSFRLPLLYRSCVILPTVPNSFRVPHLFPFSSFFVYALIQCETPTDWCVCVCVFVSVWTSPNELSLAFSRVLDPQAAVAASSSLFFLLKMLEFWGLNSAFFFFFFSFF